MTPTEFIAKWRQLQLTERSASQQHFLDLCDLLGHPKPVAVDTTGESFTFEKGTRRRGDQLLPESRGWADVWKKGCFAWEYKGPHRNLDQAYAQLQQYREALENPPLLVVSDMQRIVIHTNFTATPVEVHDLRLIDLDRPECLDKLWALFHEPEKLRPGLTSERITSQAAAQLAELAQSMRTRGIDPRAVARFLDRIVFCLFAEDIALLPEDIVTRLLAKTHTKPELFAKYCRQLFQAMADGGDYFYEPIRRFNGNLFDDCQVPETTAAELARLQAVAHLDWSAIDPSIFGTLFERGMDPAKRSQLGAHYTCRADIEALIEPVAILPLRREWAQAQTTIEWLLASGTKPSPTALAQAAAELRPAMPPPAKPFSPLRARKAHGEATLILRRFHERLATVQVLDPACGSGNFLYVTLQKLKELEKAVIVQAQDRLGESLLPLVGPWQLHGLELSPYAHDLAQMTVWIGYLQWTRANGFGIAQDPVLRDMAANFQCRDAILAPADSANPSPPTWPAVDFIVGNPPFLGGKLLRRELGDAYVDHLFAAWAGRVPPDADLCCYWFEQARAQIAAGACRRAGLLATQGIRSGANRQVLDRLKESGDIFFAESDRPWVLDGANVHISMVGFDDGSETVRRHDGQAALAIHANLTATVANLTTAVKLPENANLCLRPAEKGGHFEIDEQTARRWLELPNPHGRPNSDVLRPWTNASNLVQTRDRLWIIDFGSQDNPNVASCYAAPFAHLDQHVRQERHSNRDERLRRLWWLHRRNGEEMRQALLPLPRMICTPRVAKHRLFVWLGTEVLPDTATYAFARDDDYFFGLLHSRFHQVWALAMGSQLREKESGFRYTPTTCFATFPLPWPPGREPSAHPLVAAIAEAARQLCELRNRWLNPPEWTHTEIIEFPATVGGPWNRWLVDSNPPPADGVFEVADGNPIGIEEFHHAERMLRQLRQEARRRQPRPGDVGLARYPRTLPRDPAAAKRLAKRTLTRLYNEHPPWLANAHRQLDQAVAAAYAATTGSD